MRDQVVIPWNSPGRKSATGVQATSDEPLLDRAKWADKGYDTSYGASSADSQGTGNDIMTVIDKTLDNRLDQPARKGSFPASLFLAERTGVPERSTKDSHNLCWLGRWSLAVILSSLGVSSLSAQVVQLPGVGTFGYSGSVSVPDQGTASLGGVQRNRSGTVTRGPIGARAFGNQSAGTSVTASVTVIDLAAMDEALLKQRTGPSSVAQAPNAATASANVGTSNNKPARSMTAASKYLHPHYSTPVVNTLKPSNYSRLTGQGVAKPKQDPNAWQMAMGPSGHAEESRARQVAGEDGTDIRYYMQKALESQQAGRIAAAQVYYQLAFEKMTPEQQERFRATQAQLRATSGKGVSEKTVAKASASPSSSPAASASPTPSGTDPNAAMDMASPF